jgi:ankyrin repeat protein
MKPSHDFCRKCYNIWGSDRNCPGCKKKYKADPRGSFVLSLSNTPSLQPKDMLPKKNPCKNCGELWGYGKGCPDCQKRYKNNFVSPQKQILKLDSEIMFPKFGNQPMKPYFERTQYPLNLSYLHAVCSDVVVQIFLHFDVPTIRNIRLTCKSWNDISKGNLIWEYRLARVYGCPKKPDQSFEQLYQWCHTDSPKLIIYESFIWAIRNRCISMVKNLLMEDKNLIREKSRFYTYRSWSSYKEPALLEASLLGFDDIVEILLKEKFSDVDCTNSENETALYMATRENHLSTMKILISHKADWTRYFGWFSLLHLACEKGYLEISKYLVEIGADVNAPCLGTSGSLGFTPLYFACREHKLDIIDFLFEKGADCSLKLEHQIEGNDRPYICGMDDHDFEHGPIHIGCRRGYLEVINKLLLHGANPNDPDDADRTPILVASMHNHCHIVKRLIEAGADPTLSSAKGVSPFSFACENGYYDIVQVLLKTGKIDINEPFRDGLTPLYVACKHGHTETVLILIESSNLLPDAGPFKLSPLCIATWKGYVDICGILLAQTKCDPNFCSPEKPPPLWNACVKGNLELVKLLVSKGANPLVKPKNGENLLYTAIENNDIELNGVPTDHTEVINWFITHHPQLLFDKNDSGETPFDLAYRKDIRIILELAGEFVKNQQDKFLQFLIKKKIEEK